MKEDNEQMMMMMMYECVSTFYFVFFLRNSEIDSEINAV